MINISIDLNKLDPSRSKKHANGANYHAFTVDKLKEVDKFGNTHCLYETQTKDERAAKAKRNYIGNGKEIVFGGRAASAQAAAYEKPKGKTEYQQVPDNNNGSAIDDLPF